MFDKYNLETTVTPITKEISKEIIKTDISPDKISEIHREYYVQAQKDLIETSRLVVNNITATVTGFKTPMLTYDYIFSFIINDKTYHHRVSTPTIYTKTEVLHELAKELSDAFVNEIFAKTYKELMTPSNTYKNE
jgi:hypothetical protein